MKEGDLDPRKHYFSFIEVKSGKEEEEEVSKGDPSSSNNIEHPGLLLRWIKDRKYDQILDCFEEGSNLDLRTDLINQLFQVDKKGLNPLHKIAWAEEINDHTSTKITKVLTDACKKEAEKKDEADQVERKTPPWLMEDERGRTPLDLAIYFLREKLALHLFSLDMVEFLKERSTREHIIFKVIQCQLHELAESMLDAIDGPYLQILTDKDGLSVLHYAPYCSDEVLKIVLSKCDPEPSNGSNRPGLLQHWISKGNLNLFKHVMIECYEEGSHLDLRMDLINQLSEPNEEGSYPLHKIAEAYYDWDSFRIAKVLTEAYDKEAKLSKETKTRPWLVKDRLEKTPLRLAMETWKEKLALHFFSLDKFEFLNDKKAKHILFYAVKRKLNELAESILEEINSYKDEFKHLLTKEDGLNALHIAPNCTEKYLALLLKDIQFHEWRGKDGNGVTVIHKWVEIGELWPFEYIAKQSDFYLSTGCVEIDWIWMLINERDINNKSPLDWAAEKCRDETTMVNIMKTYFEIAGPYPTYQTWLLEELKEERTSFTSTAMSNRRQELVLFFLSRISDENAEEYIAKQELIFKAVEKKCFEVVEYLLERGLRKESILKRYDENNRENILHFASQCSAITATGKLLLTGIVEKFPHLMDEKNHLQLSPLDIAAEAGTTWLVELFLKKDRHSIQKSPGAWIRACERSHISIVLAFIDVGQYYFRSHCREMQDSPLHRLKNLSYADYEELLKRELIMELKNTKNKDGKTPLQMALQNEDINLAKNLLIIKDVDRTTKDMDLLKNICDRSEEWKALCKTIGVDPTAKLTYIKQKTDLTEMRTIISLVAALLATITFTAGFTLPGGVDDNSGEAILGKKPSFMVFLFANSYAMCCSMLVLFCIIWSMISDHDESSVLIDRSLVLLKQSLYGTLIAFGVGVYLVIHHQSLWLAILIIVMCGLVIVLAGRTLLSYALKLIPTAEDELWWQFWNKKYALLPVSERSQPLLVPMQELDSSSRPTAATSS